MRKLLVAFGIAALAAGTIAYAADKPPRSAVKELFVHAPSYVQSGQGVWTGIRKSDDGNGYVGEGSPAETTNIFNPVTASSYKREIYNVTWKEAPSTPRNWTAQVVFEDYGRTVTMPAPTNWVPEKVPVLVEKKSNARTVTQTVSEERWTYK